MTHETTLCVRASLDTAAVAQALERARIDCRAGRFGDAEAICRHAVEVQPDHGPALELLGMIRTRCGDLGEGIELLRRACALAPGEPAFHNNLGNAFQCAGQTEAALASYERALALAPGFAEALFQLGTLSLKTGRLAQALTTFEDLVRLRPEAAEAHADLASALLQADRVEEAERCCHRALELKPDYAWAHNNLGAVEARKAQLEKAEASFRRALALAPGCLDMRINLVAVLCRQNRREEATAQAQRALALDPTRADAHYQLTSLKVFEREDDPDLAAMRRLADDRSLPEPQRLFLSFALGKACDDLGQCDLAFGHFAAGNQARCRQGFRNLYGDRAQAEKVMAVFHREMLAAKAGFGHPSRLPVFLVGMPRAGKTLVEGLLARHAGVYAGGERSIVELTREDFGQEIGDEVAAYPDGVPHLTREQAWRAAQRHLQGLRLEAPEAVRATNTMPGNYLYVGLIHLLFPGAPIVHCVRDPLDTCLSCYFKLFHGGWDFTYDLEALGHNYVAYRRLMRHWQELLPGAILEVRYEDLVADPEAVGRTVARFCGLDDTPSRSRTAAQQAFHAREVARWRRYRAHLGPLERILAELYPAGLDRAA